MATKRSGKRKNRKIKFSEDNYIEKHYMKGKKAVIPLKLEKISDLYMKHDYKQRELADEVCNYIEEIAYMIPINTDIEIEVHCPQVDDETQERIRKSIKNNYGIEIDDCDYDLNTQNRKIALWTFVGIVLLVFNIVFDKHMGSILSNFITVLWWVAIWDMVELAFDDNNEIRWKRLNYQQLYDSKITFVFDDGINPNIK